MTDEEKRDELINSALDYERAISVLNTLIPQLRADGLAARKKARQEGKRVDRSYRILTDALDALRGDFQAKSDALWQEAEPLFADNKSPWQNLANAVLKAAANDYASALGDGIAGRGTVVSVRHFAKSDYAKTLTNIDFESVLNRIDRGRKAFAKLVKERGAEIRAETLDLRKRGRLNSESRIRCPMCGGGLYEFKVLDAKGRSHRIKCSGCALSAVWTEKEGEKHD